MTTLVWDQLDARRYEAGVKCGVFYPDDGPGIVWNGILSVDETATSEGEIPHYVDGIKFLTSIGSKNYQARLTAFSAPSEFLAYAGQQAIVPGFLLLSQPKRRFNFSYQTTMSDGYKIHLVYNVLATPVALDYKTMGDAADPSNLSWQFDAVPVQMPGFKPSPHFVVSSVDTPSGILEDLEDILYGTAILDPEFPTVEELATLFGVTP